MKLFKQIEIGGLGRESLLDKLKENQICFNEYALTLFSDPNFSASIVKRSVYLVKASPLDLGLSSPSSFNDIVKEAASLGLILCPLVLGAFLRLEYLEQSEGPYLTIASEKTNGDPHYPNGFYLRNIDNALWLRGYRASDDYLWETDSEFVFMKENDNE